MSSEFGVRNEIKTPNSELNTSNFRFIADAMIGRLAREPMGRFAYGR